MTRNHRSAKSAGTQLETWVAGYLAEYVDDRIERRTKGGALDRGDIAGLRHLGQRLVVECKNTGGQVGPYLAAWMAEAEVERGNDDAVAGLVVAKRRGTTQPGDQWVICTLRDLVAILTGSRPPE